MLSLTAAFGALTISSGPFRCRRNDPAGLVAGICRTLLFASHSVLSTRFLIREYWLESGPRDPCAKRHRCTLTTGVALGVARTGDPAVLHVVRRVDRLRTCRSLGTALACGAPLNLDGRGPSIHACDGPLEWCSGGGCMSGSVEAATFGDFPPVGWRPGDPAADAVVDVSIDSRRQRAGLVYGWTLRGVAHRRSDSHRRSWRRQARPLQSGRPPHARIWPVVAAHEAENEPSRQSGQFCRGGCWKLGRDELCLVAVEQVIAMEPEPRQAPHRGTDAPVR